MKIKRVTLPLDTKTVLTLRAGDIVLISGEVLTCRDCAHKRIFEYLKKGIELPFVIEGAAFFYAGPCPAPPGKACGSCGPTTSARMDSFAPRLYDMGLSCVIGKGEVSKEVRDAIARNKRVYFAAVGGAGALCGNAVVSCECVAFPDLLSEAVYKMELKDLPAVVAADAFGGDVYAAARAKK